MKVIVPIDFSKNALVAANRAFELALKYNWQVFLVHVYDYTEGEIEEEYIDLMVQGLESEMDDLKSSISARFPSVSFSAMLVRGLFVKVIHEIIQNTQPQLIIMGTKGASGWKHLTYGSNTYKVIDSSPVPVLAIPENVSSLIIRRVGVLTNFKEEEKEKLAYFSRIFDTDVEYHLFHFNEGEEAPFLPKVDPWRAEMAQVLNSDKVFFAHDTRSGRLDGHDDLLFNIEFFCQQSGIDVLLLIHNRKSFFRSFFRRSLVRNVAHKINIPMFFYKQ